MRASIRELTEAVHGTLLCGNPETVIEHLSIDSRVSEGNDLFIPIIGARTDAHDFIGKAFENGCVASLTSRAENVPDPQHPLIRVQDTVEALHEIGRFCRKRVPIPAVGVTGSVGKTTTREMISCALSAGMKVFKTARNYNSSVGLPVTLSLMSNEYDAAVLELGMNVPGELGEISEIAGIDIAVVTNIGVAHMEFYGSREAICREKLTISRGFGDKEGLLVLNGDDDLLYENRGLTGHPYVLYGTNPRCEYRAENIHTENGQYCFDSCHDGKRLPVRLSVLGEHNVLNAAAALTVAERMGVDTAAAADRLSSFTGFSNRLQQIRAGECIIIDDTYNASPDSMKAGVRVLSAYTARGRKTAVLGDMKELGPDAPLFHRQVGTAIASEPIDRLIVVGELGREIAKGALDAGAHFQVLEMADNREASGWLCQNTLPGDVIYLKASNAMHLKEITAALQERLGSPADALLNS